MEKRETVQTIKETKSEKCYLLEKLTGNQSSKMFALPAIINVLTE